MLLFSDRRVLELRRARTEVTTLDRDIAAKKEENEKLREAIEAAHRHELPAEKVAREELHLVQPDDMVLLYPEGSLTSRRENGALNGLPKATPLLGTAKEASAASTPVTRANQSFRFGGKIHRRPRSRHAARGRVNRS